MAYAIVLGAITVTMHGKEFFTRKSVIKEVLACRFVAKPTGEKTSESDKEDRTGERCCSHHPFRGTPHFI